MSTTPFQFDVFNNTSRTIKFTITGNFYLQGAQGQYTVAPGTWMSAQNSNAPFPLVLLNETGSLNFQVQDVATTNTGSFVLEFDDSKLTNFPGMAFYGSAGDIASSIKTTEVAYVGYIFPLLYMNQLYGGAPLAVLMLVEAANASPDVATPYAVN